jgi:hypothetical protein
MNVQIPPAIFYFIGTLLLVFGGMRAYYLGWKRKPAAGAGGTGNDDLDEQGSPWARDRGYKRHITFGLLWVVMGLFLMASTLINSRR